MTRWLPYPLLSAALAAMWLLLNQSLSPGHLLLAAVVGVTGALVFAELQVPQGRVQRLGIALALLWLVFVDIVRSNLAVARIVLRGRAQKRVSGFIEMPLELRDPRGLAAMACIITATPGTSWARHDVGRNVLVIHVFDLLDEEEWMRRFKSRYERRLKEIFE